MPCSGGHQIRISSSSSPNDVVFSSGIQHSHFGYNATARTPENTNVPTIQYTQLDGHNPSDGWQADTHVRSIAGEL